MDLFGSTEFYEDFLGVIWMDFVLNDCWFDSGSVVKVSDQRNIKITDSKTSGETGINQFFHSSPGVDDRDLVLVNCGFLIITQPRSRIHFLEWDEFQANWKMHHIHVNILKSKIF